jgi:hypothetical protein
MLVDFPQEMKRLDVFLAAEAIGNPLAFAPPVIQVQHGSHCIHPQSVNVIFVEPEQRAADEEALDFMAAVIEHKRVPVGMLALARIRVLV